MIGMAGNVIPVYAATTFQPDEMFMIMKASRSRIITIEATLEQRGYQYADDQQYTDKKKGNPILSYVQEMEYRRAGDRIFCQITTTSYTPAGQPVSLIRETAEVGSKWTRLLREEPLGDKNYSGVIRTERELPGMMSATPDVIFWHSASEDWDKRFRRAGSRAFVEYDNTAGYYVLEYPIGDNADSPWYRYTIDPSKGYMPITREWLASDKKSLGVDKCEDFRDVNGFQVPFRFSWYYPDGRIGGQYTFKQISINKDIPSEKLTFEFPRGTQVQDKVRGIQYKVGDNISEMNTVVDSNHVDIKLPNDAGIAPSASNIQLADVAMKAQELLDKEKQAATGECPVIPIEISPSCVWVLPGKNEYVFSVNSKSDELPGLVNHSIEKKGLVLDAVDNQILSSNKIKVILERPESLKDYADSVMTLEFNDQKAIIHFIAAPLD
jgi:hypothetical protein